MGVHISDFGRQVDGQVVVAGDGGEGVGRRVGEVGYCGGSGRVADAGYLVEERGGQDR